MYLFFKEKIYLFFNEKIYLFFSEKIYFLIKKCKKKILKNFFKISLSLF